MRRSRDEGVGVIRTWLLGSDVRAQLPLSPWRTGPQPRQREPTRTTPWTRRLRLHIQASIAARWARTRCYAPTMNSEPIRHGPSRGVASTTTALSKYRALFFVRAVPESGNTHAMHAAMVCHQTWDKHTYSSQFIGGSAPIFVLIAYTPPRAERLPGGVLQCAWLHQPLSLFIATDLCYDYSPSPAVACASTPIFP